MRQSKKGLEFIHTMAGTGFDVCAYIGKVFRVVHTQELAGYLVFGFYESEAARTNFMLKFYRIPSGRIKMPEDTGGSRRYRKKPDEDSRGMRKMGALILFLIVTAVCLVLDRDLFFS